MFNLYDYSENEGIFRKLDCDGLLVVEYQCIKYVNVDSYWSECEHIVYVTSGKKKWITTRDGEVIANKGEAVYCKKGACVINNFYEEDFCALIFFFPLEFIQETVYEFTDSFNKYPQADNPGFQVKNLDVDITLQTYFQSVISYFFQKTSPSKHLVRLKFKELLLKILTADENSELSRHLLSSVICEKTNLRKIMSENLNYNLQLEDYARICNMSLASFKRHFKQEFHVSPWQWIVEQRLISARNRLIATPDSINDVAFLSGFESASHFIRCFKKKFGIPPLQYRQGARMDHQV